MTTELGTQLRVWRDWLIGTGLLAGACLLFVSSAQRRRAAACGGVAYGCPGTAVAPARVVRLSPGPDRS